MIKPAHFPKWNADLAWFSDAINEHVRNIMASRERVAEEFLISGAMPRDLYAKQENIAVPESWRIL